MDELSITNLISTPLNKRSKDIRLESINISKQMEDIIMVDLFLAYFNKFI